MKCNWDGTDTKCKCNVNCKLEQLINDGKLTGKCIGKCPVCGKICMDCFNKDSNNDKKTDVNIGA